MPIQKKGVKPTRVRGNDSKIDELKLGGLLRAIYHTSSEGVPESLSFCRNEARSSASGDFYWARRGKKYAVIVVGDASGHNAYAAMISAVIGLKLNEIWRTEIQKSISGKHAKTQESAASACGVALRLATLFQGVIAEATNTLRQMAAEAPRSRLLEAAISTIEYDGYVAAFIVLNRDGVEIVSMGIPVFLVPSRGKPGKPIGEFSDFGVKQVSAKWTPDGMPSSETVPETARFLVAMTDGILKEGENKNRRYGMEGIERSLARSGTMKNPKHLVQHAFAAVEKHRKSARSSGKDDDRLIMAVDLGFWRKSLQKKSKKRKKG